MQLAEEIATAVSITIAAMAAVIALATYVRGGKSEAKGDAAKDAEVITKLDFIGNDLKDIKADNRRTKSEVNEVRQIAMHAQERADAAHNRLDRAGIDVVKD